MKKDKIIYWVATGVVAAGMSMSAFMYLSANPEIMVSFQALGIPGYLVVMLGVAKLLGAIALLVPIWDRIKEWAYAGFTFVFLGAIWTHVATGTPWVPPFIAMILLGVSYTFHGRLKAAH